VFVHESIYDKVVEKSAALAKARVVGDPLDPKSQQGPQVNDEQFKKVLGYIEAGKRQGARLVAGGQRVGSRGYFVAPTVFADVSDDMIIAQEEIFGPVMSILKFKTEEEVIKRANATMYGLAAGVWTKDISRAHRVASKIRAGTVWINNYNTFDAAVPFGGFRSSGLGRELGEYGLLPYLEVKSVVCSLK